MAVIFVFDSTENAVAAVPPKDTPVAPVRWVPVIVTTVPPAVEPDEGETPDTVGRNNTGGTVVDVVDGTVEVEVAGTLVVDVVAGTVDVVVDVVDVEVDVVDGRVVVVVGGTVVVVVVVSGA